MSQTDKNNSREFLTGAQAVVRACFDAGAGSMYGYPITPATEIFTGWIKQGGKYLQTEDEIAAGFAICGAILAGEKSFTATAGPGTVLMQDAMSMAEGMRLPFVVVVAQRGGPSSGTVIYSQQEVTLACYGGNGEGLRLVYSLGSLEELYSFTRRAFNESWQYRFPAVVLTDGYLLKTRGAVVINKDEFKNFPAEVIIQDGANTHLENIHTLEEDLFDKLKKYEEDYNKMSPLVASAVEVETADAEILIVAHGIVGAAAEAAVKILRVQGIRVGLLRPTTLRPFPKNILDKRAEQAKKIVIVESSFGQLAQIVRAEMEPKISTPVEYMQFPGLGVGPEVIAEFVNKMK